MAGKPDGGHVLVRDDFDPGGARAAWPRTRTKRLAGILLAAGLVIPATACDSYVDGDQWAGVIVTNNTNEPVVLDLRKARNLSPGQTTLLHVDSNSNPQAVRIRGANGRVLGCLIFRFQTTSAETFSANVSDVTACGDLRPLTIA